MTSSRFRRTVSGIGVPFRRAVKTRIVRNDGTLRSATTPMRRDALRRVGNGRPVPLHTRTRPRGGTRSVASGRRGRTRHARTRPRQSVALRSRPGRRWRYERVHRVRNGAAFHGRDEPGRRDALRRVRGAGVAYANTATRRGRAPSRPERRAVVASRTTHGHDRAWPSDRIRGGGGGMNVSIAFATARRSHGRDEPDAEGRAPSRPGGVVAYANTATRRDALRRVRGGGGRVTHEHGHDRAWPSDRVPGARGRANGPVVPAIIPRPVPCR
ncbi:MAG: hypothetical protein KatS3mg076_2366 [Candidatus Binatia bacterium]|nr:MAG: hypothetical protein KatS3mg076_2366 [Candidatus Binatia bacterium]